MEHLMKSTYLSALAAAGTAAAAHATQTHEHHTKNILGELNPNLSVVIDAFYFHENSDEGLGHILEEMPGFGHGHADEEHAHEQENGFNLREVELYLSGEVDGYFSAETTLAFTEDEAEVETATLETTALPHGFTIKAGKFFSDFGIVNAQHPHQWNFADQPLVYALTLGDHGLNEVGIQGAWKMEAPFLLQVGAEALQGDNEKMFAHEAGEVLPSHNGPRLGVAWLKIGPQLEHAHILNAGLFGGGGIHQEIHEETGGDINHLDGHSYFAGASTFYHYSAHGDRGQGDLTVQAEYFYRNKDLDLIASDDPGAPLGEAMESNQDGYYLQALYGFQPRWRGGLRWEQVGLINEEKEPGEARETFGDSWRATAMADFRPSNNSLIRLQASNGDYATEHGTENIWEGYVQVLITLGSHRHEESHACGGHL
jgi:hypothetical protein